MVVDGALLVASLFLVHMMARGALWSPYYKITVFQTGEDTVVEVNNIFHQSMAPVAHKEYFYQWPYTTFGTFKNVLILGAGSGTDVAAALMHGAEHVDAVEIDPTISVSDGNCIPIIRSIDPRVTVINDDARHFLHDDEESRPRGVRADRFADAAVELRGGAARKLHVHEESFRAVRDRLDPDGLLVVYNYFREKWLVTGRQHRRRGVRREPRVHVHEARAYLRHHLAGPRLATLPSLPVVPDQVA